jgi:outer membrane receptor protein involved in Fe transport
MRKTLTGIVVFLLLFSPLLFSQSRDTGAIRGKVTDEQKSPLPGATVTLTSPNLMGARNSVTDANGDFRFPALPPGTYGLRAELSGFGTHVREAIRLTTTVTLAIDVVLKPAAVSEEVTVVAQSPTIDVKSTETASVTLSSEILRNIPYSQFTSDIVNMAPAVNNDTAYGASSGTGISWQMDGVGVGDPAGGTSWVFLNHNTIEEAKIMGIGLPAEYGNFTGVIFNLITKSGGNKFSGHVEFLFQGKQTDKPAGLWQTVNNGAYAADFPTITSPIDSMMDVNFQLGGPIIKDKLWFYMGAQMFKEWWYATGFPEADKYNEPRAFIKLTSQFSAKTSFALSVERDNYERSNRGASATVLPEATVTQTGPEWVANFSLTQILSAKTFFDVKGAYFDGTYTLEPKSGRDVAGHFFQNDNPDMPGSGNLRHYSSGYFADHPRTRYQVNASLTHYAEDFIQGNHDFKFGAEFERSIVRDVYGYTGVNHRYYVDYWNPEYGYNGPYLAYEYEGYSLDSRFVRLEAFAQDNWQVSKRLNISLGLRFSQNWGQAHGYPGTPWNTNRIAPRLGFTFDLLGDKSTILKGHYGQFTEGMYAYFYDRLNSDISDRVDYYWDGEWVESQRTTHGTWRLDPQLKHPYLNQFTVGIERELFKDASLSVTYVNRRWKNPVGAWDDAATWEIVPVYNSALDQTFDIYQLTSGDVHDFWIGNVDVPRNGVPVGLYRKYWCMEVLFNKRFSNRWQLMASYVYGRSFGNLDNGSSDDIGYGIGSADNYVFNPNFFINAEGYSTNDPTHMIKLQGTYVLPLDINFSAYFHAITGDAWTTRVRSSRLAQGRVTFFAEPRGTYHYPIDAQLDLRLEKTFNLAAKYRLGLILDVFNVFNANTVTSWGTRAGYDWNFDQNDPEWPYAYSTDGHDLLGLTLPRRARLGLRLTF